MKIRGRLGILATAVSGLLAAGLLFSAPAFAWDTEIQHLEAKCPPGSDKNVVSFVLKLFEEGHKGTVEANVSVGGEIVGQETRSFDEEDQFLEFEFEVPGPENDHTVVQVHTMTTFEDSKETPESKASTTLEKCQKEESTTTTQAPTTTEAPTSTAAPTTTVAAPSSTEAAAPTTAGAPSTTLAAIGAESLPKTGSNSTLPLLLVAIVLVVGGAAALFATRIRGRHAK
jgi:LPXTG-motif cell wall-anchored protein